MAIAYQKEISISIIVIVVLIMVFKPSILGMMYNNMIGKLFLVACIVFLTLKHTIAGLLGVVFIAVIASNSVFEGNANKEGYKDEKDDKTEPAASVTSTEAPKSGGDPPKNDTTSNNIAAAKAALNALS
jgi:hypothetical protein